MQCDAVVPGAFPLPRRLHFALVYDRTLGRIDVQYYSVQFEYTQDAGGRALSWRRWPGRRPWLMKLLVDAAFPVVLLSS